MPPRTTPSDRETQIEKFRDLARELETDDDEARFDERLKKLAKTPRAPKGVAPSKP
jgi:hypothetical protein